MNTTATEVTGSVALWAGISSALMNLSTSVIGVPLNVVAAASLGVIAGLAWNKEDMTRRQQVAIGAGSVIAACAVTSLLGVALGHYQKVELDPGHLAPLAILIAFFGPRWVPAVNERIGPWLDKLPFIGHKGG